MLRDNFTIPTWLLLGALVQGFLCLLPYHNIALVAPASLALIGLIARTLLITFGILKNPYADGVIEGRTAALYADETGAYEKPGDQQICVIVLAVRSNHPLGLLADGFKDVGDYFNAMCAELDKDPKTHGFLGNSAWLAAGDRGVSSEFMSIMYFDSPESLHAYAHGPLHTETMEWWHKTEQKHKHIGIMHEVYAAPKNSWEGIYVNYHPTGIGATTREAEIDGKKVWMNPLVHAKGPLRYSKGRMGRPFGEKEWVAFENMTGNEKA